MKMQALLVDDLFYSNDLRSALQTLDAESTTGQGWANLKLRHNVAITKFLLGELSGADLLRELLTLDAARRRACAAVENLFDPDFASSSSPASSLPASLLSDLSSLDLDLTDLLDAGEDPSEDSDQGQGRTAADLARRAMEGVESLPPFLNGPALAPEFDPSAVTYNTAVVLAQLGFRSAAAAVLRYVTADLNALQPVLALDASLLLADLYMRSGDLPTALRTLHRLDLHFSPLSDGPRAQELFPSLTANPRPSSPRYAADKGGLVSLEEGSLALHLMASQAWNALGDTERAQEHLLLARDAEARLRALPGLPQGRTRRVEGLAARAGQLGARILSLMGQGDTARELLSQDSASSTAPPSSPAPPSVEVLHNSALLDHEADKPTFAALKLSQALQAAYAASSLGSDCAPSKVAAVAALPAILRSAGLQRLASGDPTLALKCLESARDTDNEDPLLLMRVAEARMKLAAASLSPDDRSAHLQTASGLLSSALRAADQRLERIVDAEPTAPSPAATDSEEGLTGIAWPLLGQRAARVDRGRLQLLRLQVLTRLAHVHLQRKNHVAAVHVSQRILEHLEQHEAAWVLQEVAYAALRFEWDLNCSFAMLQLWEALRAVGDEGGAGRFAARALAYVHRLGARAPEDLKRACNSAVALGLPETGGGRAGVGT